MGKENNDNGIVGILTNHEEIGSPFPDMLDKPWDALTEEQQNEMMKRWELLGLTMGLPTKHLKEVCALYFEQLASAIVNGFDPYGEEFMTSGFAMIRKIVQDLHNNGGKEDEFTLTKMFEILDRSDFKETYEYIFEDEVLNKAEDARMDIEAECVGLTCDKIVDSILGRDVNMKNIGQTLMDKLDKKLESMKAKTEEQKEEEHDA